jgi:energy-coupling factor transporter ATP-binding protein EcfA2
MLTLEQVTYRYAGAAAPSLHEVDLSLEDGTVVGLVGAAEAGKTTVCLVASGLAPRTIRGTLSGRVMLDGLDVRDTPIHQLVPRVGICFQDPGTQLSGVCATVFEEVAFGPMNLGLPLEDVLARTDRALATLGIEDLADRDPARLSGGQMQLVAMGGVLALRPAHLILDEPTAQLDPAGTNLVAAAIERLAADGASILITEQRTDLLERICDRIVALDAGRVALSGGTREVLGDPRLAALGVPEPARVRLRRLLEEAGLDAQGIEAALA